MKVTIDLPFCADNAELLECLIEAHQTAAVHNSNLSSQVAFAVANSSGEFSKGVIAAISAIGGAHAPLYQARLVFRLATEEWIKGQTRVPGFGNSFYKTSIDPSFEKLDKMLETDFPETSARIKQLHTWVGKVYPNAALYTAAVCELCQVPDGLESALFIVARTPMWAAQVTGVN